MDSHRVSNSGYTNSSHTNSTDSNSDVFQSLLHKIDSYESYRQCSSSNSLLRNKVYWRELRQIQREGFQDNDQLALQLRAKATLFTQLTKAVTDYSVSSYSGNSSTTGNNSDSTGNYFNNTVTIPKNNVGYLTKSALLESDSSWTSKFTELTKFLLEELLVSYEQELQLLKSHVQMLWRRGTCLLIAITLADNRVKDYEAQLRECCRSYRNDSINTNYAAADIISNSVGNSVGNRGTASPQLAGTNSAPECLTEESIAQDSQGVAENSSTTIDSAGRHANVDGNSVESINSNSVGATSRYNGKDVWILEMKYSVALIRFYQVSEECNKQFGLLFALAKDLEFYRINTITKTAEMFLLKEQELWQQIAVMSSVAQGTVRNIPSIVGDPHKTMSMQLAMRINSRNNYSSNRNNTNSENSNSKNTNSENSTSEVDNYGEIVRFQNEIESRIRQNIDSSDSLSAGKADEGTKTQNSVSSSASANNNISVSVENPINSTMVLMSGLFTMQDIGVILTSWVPVLLVLTKDSILHIFKVNSADITPPKRNSSDNTSAMEVAAFNSVVTESRKGIEDTIFVPMSITATSLKEEHGKYLNSGNGISSNSLPTGKNRLTGKGNSPKPNDAQDKKNEKKAEKPKPKPLKTLKKLAMTPDTINDIIENFLDDLDKFENNSTAANKANNSESDMNVFEIVSSLLVSDTFMNPIQSVNITNSSVVLRPSVNQNDNILEIYETIHNSSTGVASYLMNSLLGSVSQRKFAFKNNSQRQLFDWISFLESKTVQHK